MNQYLAGFPFDGADSFWSLFFKAAPFATFGVLGYLALRYRQTRVRGPAVVGVALITGVKVAPWVIGNPGRGNRPCRIELRVQIHGREPYAATTRQNFDAVALASPIQPGRLVPVRVEQDRPRRILIDLSHPLTGPLASPA